MLFKNYRALFEQLEDDQKYVGALLQLETFVQDPKRLAALRRAGVLAALDNLVLKLVDSDADVDLKQVRAIRKLFQQKRLESSEESSSSVTHCKYPLRPDARSRLTP